MKFKVGPTATNYVVNLVGLADQQPISECHEPSQLVPIIREHSYQEVLRHRFRKPRTREPKVRTITHPTSLAPNLNYPDVARRKPVIQRSGSPKVALLDEIDSGLDIDAVKQVAEAVEAMRSPDLAVVIITHYSRILRYLSPDRIHVMIDGRIVDSGGSELAEELESGGYEALRRRLGIEKVVEDGPVRKPADFFTETPFDV